MRTKTETLKKDPNAKRVKTGGRKKGTPNKVSNILRDRLAEIGADPGEFLALVMLGKKTFEMVVEGKVVDMPPSMDIRVQAAKGLLAYVYPRLNAIMIGAGPEALDFAKVFAETLKKEKGPKVING